MTYKIISIFLFAFSLSYGGIYSFVPDKFIAGVGSHYATRLNTNSSMFMVEAGPLWYFPSYALKLGYAGAFSVDKGNHADFNFLGAVVSPRIPFGNDATFMPGIGLGAASTKRHRDPDEISDDSKAGLAFRATLATEFNSHEFVSPVFIINYFQLFTENQIGYPRIFGIELGLLIN